MLQSLLTSCLLLLGADFSEQCTDIIVPAAKTPGSQTYIIEKFFTVVDDNINEVEQSFALIAELGDDIPSNCFVETVGLSDCRCFQAQEGDTQCFGRRGATEIRITDNDRKNKLYMYYIIVLVSQRWSLDSLKEDGLCQKVKFLE